jgi:hypothetical protein
VDDTEVAAPPLSPAVHFVALAAIRQCWRPSVKIPAFEFHQRGVARAPAIIVAAAGDFIAAAEAQIETLCAVMQLVEACCLIAPSGAP